MSYIQDRIFKLKGQVQHYAWGGYDFIPNWLGVENKERKPFAEYWMGTHPSAPSHLITKNGELSLHQLINDYPEEFLGKEVQQKFGELPYLFKVLDVRDMLSIQVHPTKEQAAKGYEAEEAAGVLVGAPHRNYKDKNHKPEIMVALSEFWLLHGFLPKEKLRDVLHSVPEFELFIPFFEDEGYKGLYEHVMHMLQVDVTKLLSSLVQREVEKKSRGELSKDQPGWWVAKLYEGQPLEDIDRGVFSIYFFNLVKVNPGEAVFQGAGIPHAYLEGQNVELMANSDNVLRGGLTPKHIDVEELFKHVLFEGITPQVLKGDEINKDEKNYPCPVPDFGIHKLEMEKDDNLTTQTSSFEIWVIMNGEMNLSGTNSLYVKKGEAIAILPNESLSISATSNVLAYRAFVP